jgi:hydrogenase nickel incorporation protein HypA/HybF
MHELSIAIAILDRAEEELARRSRDHPGEHLRAIHVAIGALCGIDARALEDAFTLARAATSMSECELRLVTVPITCRCPCSIPPQAVASPQELRCDRCGRPALEILGGRELEVRALEIIDEPVHAAR